MTDVQETNRTNVLFDRIAALIEQSRQFVVSAVNVAEVRTRFEMGRFIFEDEQQGERATYGKQILKNLSIRLTERFGNDWGNDVATIRLPHFPLSWPHYLILMRSEMPTSMLRSIHSICQTRPCCKGN